MNNILVTRSSMPSLDEYVQEIKDIMFTLLLEQCFLGENME